MVDREGSARPGQADGHGLAPREARIVLVTRLRWRHGEISKAIFARVSDPWFDRMGIDDPEYLAGLRAAGAAALDYVLVGIERLGEPLEAVPSALLAQARRAARAGVGLDTVLRRYLAGYAVLEDIIMQEAEHDRLLGQGRALRHVLWSISLLVDHLIAAVSGAYSKEIGVAGDLSAALDARASARKGPDRSGPCGGSAVSGGGVAPTRRERMVAAMVEVAGEHGFANTSVKLLTSRAGVSTSTFYKEFESLQDCFLAVLDLGLERVGGLIVQAFAGEERWQDGVRSALASLLVFFDSEPLQTRVWFVEAMAAGSWALRRREEIVLRVRSMIIEYWVLQGESPPEPVAAAGVMASILGLIQASLVNDEPGPLIELLGPLMGLVTMLYLDKQDVRREVERAAGLARAIRAGAVRWAPPSPPLAAGVEPDVLLPGRLANPSARRVRECLLYLAGRPGSSNSEIAAAIGVAHKSNISRLLSCLLKDGLAVKRSAGAGAPNAWRLTERGERAALVLARQGPYT
jgi:AcrR family transcriptional regulator